VIFQLRWLVAVSAMMSLWTNGDYFIAEFLVPTAVLGGYYFGYQLAVQPGRLFNVSVLNVLVPVVRRVAHDQARLQSALRRMLGLGGFAITTLNVALLAMIEPIERVVWAGRWSETVPAVQMLAIGLSFASIFNIATAPFMAQRRYRDALLCHALRAVGVVGGAAAGSVLGATISSIAGWVSASMAITAVIGIAWVLRDYGVRAMPVVGHMFRCTLPPIVSAIAAALVGSMVLDAAGDGRVERAAPTGTVGNFIKSVHSHGYETSYAHLDRFAKGIAPGVKVRQGQVIGYVGSTGRSTGPHLHYEMIRNGRHVDPLAVDLPNGDPVPGDARDRWLSELRPRVALLSSIPQPNGVRMAQAIAIPSDSDEARDPTARASSAPEGERPASDDR
jgi:hypothetical protein